MAKRKSALRNRCQSMQLRRFQGQNRNLNVTYQNGVVSEDLSCVNVSNDLFP